MLGQTSLAPPALGLCLRLFCARKANADGAAPGIEGIKDVVLAEIDLHRPASNPLGVVPHEVGVDALARDLERNALCGPAADTLEGRSDDSDQVAVVLAAEVGFDLAAVLVCVHLGAAGPAQRGLFLSHTILSPWSVRSGSTCSMRSTSGAITPARPPVAMQTAFWPSSSRMRRTRPSTNPTYP